MPRLIRSARLAGRSPPPAEFVSYYLMAIEDFISGHQPGRKHKLCISRHFDDGFRFLLIRGWSRVGCRGTFIAARLISSAAFYGHLTSLGNSRRRCRFLFLDGMARAGTYFKRLRYICSSILITRVTTDDDKMEIILISPPR